MSPHPSLFLTSLLMAGILAGIAPLAMAEDAPPKTDAPPSQPAPPAKAAHKPMKMNEPMAGEMKREGTMKGDMKKAAEKKDREMKDMMQSEEKAAKK